MKKNNAGFTLIELLVVIAIIGILASIVLASLSSARSKGRDASIKSELSNMRAQAELYGGFSNLVSPGSPAKCDTGNGGLFDTTTPNALGPLINAIAAQNNTTVTCASSAFGVGRVDYGSWAVAAPLSDGTIWCVDSTGTLRDTVGGGATAYTVATANSGNAAILSNTSVCH